MRSPGSAKICPVTNAPITSIEDCPVCQKPTVSCSFCGETFFTSKSGIVCGENAILCDTCYANKDTCTFCKKGEYCPFLKDTSIDIAPYIMQQVRKDPLVTQIMQVKNPERVKVTCMCGCPCFDEETFECRKQLDHWCQNHLSLI